MNQQKYLVINQVVYSVNHYSFILLNMINKFSLISNWFASAFEKLSPLDLFSHHLMSTFSIEQTVSNT